MHQGQLTTIITGAVLLIGVQGLPITQEVVVRTGHPIVHPGAQDPIQTVQGLRRVVTEDQTLLLTVVAPLRTIQGPRQAATGDRTLRLIVVAQIGLRRATEDRTVRIWSETAPDPFRKKRLKKIRRTRPTSVSSGKRIKLL